MFLGKPRLFKVQLVFIKNIDSDCFKSNFAILTTKFLTILLESTEHCSKDILDFNCFESFACISPSKILLPDTGSGLPLKNEIKTLIVGAVSTTIDVIVFSELGD